MTTEIFRGFCWYKCWGHGYFDFFLFFPYLPQGIDTFWLNGCIGEVLENVVGKYFNFWGVSGVFLDLMDVCKFINYTRNLKKLKIMQSEKEFVIFDLISALWTDLILTAWILWAITFLIFKMLIMNKLTRGKFRRY